MVNLKLLHIILVFFNVDFFPPYFCVIPPPWADGGVGHWYSSVTQSVQDVSANLDSAESANCVYLDSSAWLWEMKQHKTATVAGQHISWLFTQNRLSKSSQQAFALYPDYLFRKFIKQLSVFSAVSDTIPPNKWSIFEYCFKDWVSLKQWWRYYIGVWFSDYSEWVKCVNQYLETNIQTNIETLSTSKKPSIPAAMFIA